MLIEFESFLIMADETDKLTYSIIETLASKLSMNDLKSIALRYMDFSNEMIRNAISEGNNDSATINRYILNNFWYRNSEDSKNVSIQTITLWVFLIDVDVLKTCCRYY